MITHADHTGQRAANRPRWMYPALAVAAVAAVLLYLGIVTPSSLLSIGLFGGMIGMHLFGHGSHGGHGGHETHGSEGATSESQATGAEADQATQETDQSTRHRGGCH